VSAINAATSKTGVTAQYDSALGGLKLTNASGNDITLTNGATANTKFNVATYKADNSALIASPLDTKGAAAVAVVNGRVTLDSQNSFAVTDAGSGLKVTAAHLRLQRSKL
jgi:flagellin